VDPRFRAEFARAFLGLGKLFAAAIGILLLVVVYIWGTLPPLDELERISPSLITRVYDRDSVLVREYYSERRLWTPLERIPRRQIEAVLAIEDQRFYRHGGVDLGAIPAAALPMLSGRRARGASTLTQQLAKLLFLGPERSLARKIREVALAVEIERTYTKDEILEFYMNQVYMGAGVYGFQSAAERYFSRPLDSLSLARQALLAGLLQRPESLRPDRRPALALERRNLVLRTMAENGAITESERRAALAEPLDLRMKPVQSSPGIEAAYFMETVRRRIERRFGKGFLDSAGAAIHTTLDRRVQELADSCLAENVSAIQRRMNVRTLRELGLPRLLKRSEDRLLADWDREWARFDSLFLRADSASAAKRFPEHLRYRKAQGAVVVLENGTGEVLALSGGIDWRESEFNRAVQAARSPGSAFKAFVYAAAVDLGASPAARVDDSPLAMPDPDDSTRTWRPANLEHDFEGPMSLRRAFYRSRNIPAIRVGMQTGLDTVAAYARRFGLGRPMRAVPSLPIGACDATPFEMTAAFSVFPNGGTWVEPRLVSRVVDRHGSPMALGEPMSRRVIGEPAAWILTGMLQDVNIRGTAADVWASGFRHPSGGKTGTSNDWRDAWYVGFTKRYTVGVWVGTDDHAPMGPGHTGTDDALPIWLDIMRGLHRGLKPEPFERPKGVKDVTVCRFTGLAAQPFCDSLSHDYRVAGIGRPIPPCRPDLHAVAEEDPEMEGLRARREDGPRSGSFFRKMWDRMRGR
jgi:penicillin-binding protein 1A